MQNERRIILVGKTGNGKSSTGNSILRKNAFDHRVSANAVTETSVMVSGINLSNNKFNYVVDTPGLLDTKKSVSERAVEIQRSVDICPKPHAFLIVFSAANRMTPDERFTIDMLRIMFGECIFDHSIVVFTNGNKFKSDSEFQQFWKENEIFVNLIKLCGNRVVRIENPDDFLTKNEGTQIIFEMIESMSDAGKMVYRYTELNTHRSVMVEHSKNYDGTGDIQSELSVIVTQIGKKIKNNKIWKTMLYGATAAAGGTMAALGAVGAIGATGLLKAAGPRNAVVAGVAVAGIAAVSAVMNVAGKKKF